MNILYFSPYPSHPVAHGNQSTIFQFGRRFQELGHKVHYALLHSNWCRPEDLLDMQRAWDTLDVLPFSNPMWPDRHDIRFDGWYDDGLGETVAGLCRKYQIDVLFCSYVMHSKILEYVPKSVIKVIDTHDKMGGRYAMLRKKGLATEFFSCTPEDEGAYLRRADIVLARRQEEADYFNEVSRTGSAIVVPHIECPNFVQKKFTEVRNVGVVASANRINLAIVKDFLDAVQRRASENQSAITVHVAGQVRELVKDLSPEDAAVFQQPWVKLHGFVPDISGFYRDMDLIVSPVTVGTGINVKTVQAMAYGMPLLTTAWGCKGIETNEPMHEHQDMPTLVDAMFSLQERPAELDRLAAISRGRYRSFFDEGDRALQSIFTRKSL